MNQIHIQNDIIKDIIGLLNLSTYCCDKLCENKNFCERCKLNATKNDLIKFIKEYE